MPKIIFQPLMICNPPSKRFDLFFADLQSAAVGFFMSPNDISFSLELAFSLEADFKSALNRSSLFVCGFQIRRNALRGCVSPFPPNGLAFLPCRLFYMQLVTPRVVATAVRMLMITCISVFQVSFFIMNFLSF